jgi:DNA-binding transcriptional ArsR family regulator
MVFTQPREPATLGVVRFRMLNYTNGDGVLIGRDEGEAARSALEAEIRANRSADAPVGIDLRGIRVMSVPFADGFFVPLLSGWLAGYYDEHPILLFGADEDVAETIAAALRLRDLAILSVGETASEADLLGGEPSLQETIKVAARLGHFKVSELADALSLTPQAANNRLKALVRMGALSRMPLAREGGGREFEYRAPRPTPSG